MPVPKSMEKKYGIIIASQTKRLEKKGSSKSAAHAQAKAITEQWMRDHKKGGPKAKKVKKSKKKY